ncbi:phosphatase PAP2 family protein [Streptomyces sp. NPDC002490]|uniref:phosphatase PAP2 family protein n=1 Tax=Streptomyces sp. NPDC002490 TaxID=3154416 RepID=UPI00332AC127
MHPVSPRSAPSPSAPTGPGLLRCALLLAGFSVLLLVLVVVRWDPLMDLDAQLARTTHRWAVADPGQTHAYRILSDWVWDPWTMRALFAVVVGWLLWRRDLRYAVWLVAACLCGTALQQGMKFAVDRDRPHWPDPVDSAHYSAFPSGHAMTATVVCGLVLWTLYRHRAPRPLWRAAVVGAAVSVLGVGLTRIWLGVHWPSDVVGGWSWGALVVVVAITAYERRPGPSRPAGTGTGRRQD